MDLAIAFDSTGSRFDLTLSGYDLTTERGMRSAVVASLFSDRRAEPDDDIPDGTVDRRGWWADSKFGSRLWLLSREKELPATLQRAREYTVEALQWLIDDDVATTITVTAERIRRGAIAVRVTIIVADGGRFSDVFEIPAEVE